MVKLNKLLVVALKPEWSHLKQLFRFQKDHEQKNLYFIEDVPGTALLQVGFGLENAKNKFAEFLKNHSCESVLHFGSCGALDAGLKVGDLVVSRGEVISTTGESLELASPHLDPLVQFLDQSELSYKTGRLLTSDKVLEDRKEKKDAEKHYLAMAVDMESYAIAKICQEKKIDYLSVRGVFDAVEDDVADLGEPFNNKGNLKPAKLAVNLMKSPKLILKVPDLQKRLALVNQRLGKVVRWFVELNNEYQNSSPLS